MSRSSLSDAKNRRIRAHVPQAIEGERPQGAADTEANDGAAFWAGVSGASVDPLPNAPLSFKTDAYCFHKTADVTRDRDSLTLLWQPPQSALHTTRSDAEVLQMLSINTYAVEFTLYQKRPYRAQLCQVGSHAWSASQQGAVTAGMQCNQHS